MSSSSHEERVSDHGPLALPSASPASRGPPTDSTTRGSSRAETPTTLDQKHNTEATPSPVMPADCLSGPSPLASELSSHSHSGGASSAAEKLSAAQYSLSPMTSASIAGLTATESAWALGDGRSPLASSQAASPPPSGVLSSSGRPARDSTAVDKGDNKDEADAENPGGTGFYEQAGDGAVAEWGPLHDIALEEGWGTSTQTPEQPEAEAPHALESPARGATPTGAPLARKGNEALRQTTPNLGGPRGEYNKRLWGTGELPEYNINDQPDGLFFCALTETNLHRHNRAHAHQQVTSAKVSPPGPAPVLTPGGGEDGDGHSAGTHKSREMHFASVTFNWAIVALFATHLALCVYITFGPIQEHKIWAATYVPGVLGILASVPWACAAVPDASQAVGDAGVAAAAASGEDAAAVAAAAKPRRGGCCSCSAVLCLVNVLLLAALSMSLVMHLSAKTYCEDGVVFFRPAGTAFLKPLCAADTESLFLPILLDAMLLAISSVRALHLGCWRFDAAAEQV